jgi:phage shock protein A
MDNQLSQQRQVVTTMKENMHRLEAKIAEAKTKKDLYIARARSAEASRRLQEMIDGGTMAAFDQVERQVLDLEARSEAMQELNSDPLERQFAALENPRTPVEQELAAMKARLGNGTSSPESLPPSS